MLQSKLLNQFTEITHGFCVEEINYSLDKNYKNYFVNQVHGKSIIDIPSQYMRGIQADGMISFQNVRLSIRTADCLPVVIYARKNKFIFAIHAGWKGLNIGIMSELAKVIQMRNLSLEEIYIAVGPHIGPCCYRVPKDRADSFLSHGYPEDIAYKSNSDWHLDIGRIAYYQCLREGFQKKQVDIIQLCTSCDISLQSYRRDGKQAGRMISFIQKNYEN